jgi:flagellar basal-body rod modification protein FlgD
MAIEAIGAPASSQSGVPQNVSLAQQDFLTILLSQLRFQDPLKPVDNQQLVAQLAQFGALEINRQQSEKIDRLFGAEASSQAIGLIGRNVSFRTQDGGTQTGIVDSVSFFNGEPAFLVRINGFPFEGVRPTDILRVNDELPAIEP